MRFDRWWWFKRTHWIWLLSWQQLNFAMQFRRSAKIQILWLIACIADHRSYTVPVVRYTYMRQSTMFVSIACILWKVRQSHEEKSTTVICLFSCSTTVRHRTNDVIVSYTNINNTTTIHISSHFLLGFDFLFKMVYLCVSKSICQWIIRVERFTFRSQSSIELH